MKQYEENGYTITEYDNGAVVKEIISEPIPEPEPIKPQPTNGEKIITILQAQEQANLDRDETDLDQTLMLLDIQLNQSLQGGTNTMSKTEQIFGGGGVLEN